MDKFNQGEDQTKLQKRLQRIEQAKVYNEKL